MENIIYQWRCSSMAGRQIVTGDPGSNRDPGFGNFRDLVTSLISRFPIFQLKIPGFASWYPHGTCVKKSCNYFCLA